MKNNYSSHDATPKINAEADDDVNEDVAEDVGEDGPEAGIEDGKGEVGVAPQRSGRGGDDGKAACCWVLKYLRLRQMLCPVVSPAWLVPFSAPRLPSPVSA
jgi:hypothetical protein